MSDSVTPDAGEEFLSKKLYKMLRRSRRGQVLWSVATHSSTICVIAFSATAAVLTQLEDWWLSAWIAPKTAATLLSLLVTIISTVQTKLGFERKWVANRMKHSALVLLKIDKETGAKTDYVKDQLKSIIDRHDKAITSVALPDAAPD